MIIYRVIYCQDVNILAKYAKNKKEARKICTQLRKREKEDEFQADREDFLAEDHPSYNVGDYMGISEISDPEKMDIGYSKSEVVHWLNSHCEVVS